MQVIPAQENCEELVVLKLSMLFVSTSAWDVTKNLFYFGQCILQKLISHFFFFFLVLNFDVMR